MTSNLFRKDLKDFDDIDVDKILEGLTDEQLEELAYDLDPDNNLLPASDRCRPQTKKEPTGRFDRQALMDYLEKKALEEADWEQNKPFLHEIRGKVYTAKVQAISKEEESLSTEFDDILTRATEDELVDLAAVLDFVGMMNQTQYHSSLEGTSHIGGGFQSVAKCQALKLVPDEPPNDTDVDECIDRLNKNDAKLTDLNLNNIKNISKEKFQNLFNAMHSNTHINTLTLANTNTTDAIVKPLIDAIRANQSLTSVNVESNFLTGDMLVGILEAINVNKTVIEFRAANQRQSCLGVKSEMRAAELIEQNEKMLRLGLTFDARNARIRVHEHLQKNNDKELRQKRMDKSEENRPQSEER